MADVMDADPLKVLLDKLCQGDAEAAQQVYLEYEPYLRRIIRRRLPHKLRSKLDSVDVVQSVWVELIGGFRDKAWHFENPSRLRAFLIKVTRNKLHDRYRKHRLAITKEQPIEATDSVRLGPNPEPRPSQNVQCDDLWNQMLALCPPHQQEVLRLKREGVPLAEIVARTGLHDGSIRRILRTLARKMALSGQPIESLDVSCSARP